MYRLFDITDAVDHRDEDSSVEDGVYYQHTEEYQDVVHQTEVPTQVPSSLLSNRLSSSEKEENKLHVE